MTKFKIGARVIGIKDVNGKGLVGLKGTILHNYENSTAIKWDKDMGGHDCNGLCKDAYGWNVDNDTIKLVDDPMQKLKESMLR